MRTRLNADPRSSHPAPWAALAAASAVFVAVVLLLVPGSGGDPQGISRYAIRVDVGAQPVSRPVPPGFVGFSIEYPSSLAYSGPDPARIDPVFLQLVRNLNPGQSPVLRFGGDTADWTWWPTPGVGKPPGIRYTLTRRWVQVTAATVRALNARLILGINFEADSRAIAATESGVLLHGIGPRYIAGFELGNEPEVYGTLPWYETAAKVPVPGRPASYGFQAYLHDYASVSGALPRTVPLVGPASGAPPWLEGLRRYLIANPRVRIATFHRYPLHRCFNPPNSSTYPTIANLLAPVASSGPATSLAAAVQAAHARGVPFRSDELNSVSCGGARGVSDTFASALWILDTLFNMARVGVDGVNIHTFRTGIYAPFALTHSGGRWSARVKPMYYGLLMFTRAAPPGSRLLPVSFHGPTGMRIWATQRPGGAVSMLVINDARRRAQTVAVRVPGAGQTATLERLRAPRVRAKGGVTIAGQSFGVTSATGLLTGAERSVRLSLIRHRFVIRVPAASAALIIAR